jgi:uncharacterized protein involved in response to NO
MLISLIGGRIIPSFTRNWLAQRKSHNLPTPFGRGDTIVLGLTLAALAIWIIEPDHRATAFACAAVAVAHTWRLSRWSGHLTRAEPLVWVLHAGYAFVPMGFLAVAAALVLPDMAPAAQHIWMAGAVGLMTLAVMTRASLGHVGRPLHATRSIAALYIALIIAVSARFVVGIFPEQGWLLDLAAGGWIAAFGGFAVIYWPILTQPRQARPKPTNVNRSGG